jgi:hypothetical protein
MTVVLWIIVSLLAIDAGLIAVLLLCRLKTPLAISSISEIAPLFVLAGVLTAVLAFIFNLRRGRSEDILEAATDLLEKAFEVLAGKEGNLTDHRHAWLSSSRLIATAEKLSKDLTEPSHKTIYREKREYWRSSFYDLIFPHPPEGLPSSFYAEKPEHMIFHSGEVRDPLSEMSLAFMYRFIRWPEGMTDPIGGEARFTDDEIERMCTFGPRGLGNLISEARALVGKNSPSK